MVNKSSIDWLMQQAEAWNVDTRDGRHYITFPKTAFDQAKEMEVMGMEMFYSDGYREGYKRALELIQWKIQNELK